MAGTRSRSSYSEFQDDVEEENKLSQLQSDPILNPLLDDLCQWLGRTLDISITPDTFTGPLQTGENLCKLALLITKKAEEMGKRCPPLRFRANAKPYSFQARCNIEAFVKWAKGLGVRDTCLFETVDIVEMKYLRNVLVCLLDVSRLADIYGVDPPELVKLEKSTKIGWQDLVALTLKRAKQNGDHRVLSVAEVSSHVKQIQQEVADAEESGVERASSIVNKWREFTRKSVKSRQETEIMEEYAALVMSATSPGPDEEDDPESVELSIAEIEDTSTSEGNQVLLMEGYVSLDSKDFNVSIQEEELIPVQSPPDCGVFQITDPVNRDVAAFTEVPSMEYIAETDQVVISEVIESPKSEVKEVLLIEDDVLSEEEDFNVNVQEKQMIIVHSQPHWDDFRTMISTDQVEYTEVPSNVFIPEHEEIVIPEERGFSSDDDKELLLIEDDYISEEEGFDIKVQKENIITVCSQPDLDDDKLKGSEENNKTDDSEVPSHTTFSETDAIVFSGINISKKSQDKRLLLEEEDIIPLKEDSFTLNVQQEHMIMVRSQPDWDGVRLRGSRDQGALESELNDNETPPDTSALQKKVHGEAKRPKRKRSSDDGDSELPEKSSKGIVNAPAEITSVAPEENEGGYNNPTFNVAEDVLYNPSSSLSSILPKETSSPSRTAVEGSKVKWGFVLCYPAVYSDEEETSLSTEQYRNLKEKRCCILLLGILLTVIGTSIAVTLGILKPQSGTESGTDSGDSGTLSWPVFYTLLAVSLLCLIIGLSLISLWMVQHFKIKDGKIVECDTDSQPSYGSIT